MMSSAVLFSAGLPGNLSPWHEWYYAYVIEGNTIKVVDACHAQNMR